MKTNETGSQSSSKDGMAIARACWEIIADNLSKAGWSRGCVSAENLYRPAILRNTAQTGERYD